MTVLISSPALSRNRGLAAAHDSFSPQQQFASNLQHEMCDFRDFTQYGLWSGQGDRYARSVSVVGYHC